MGDRLICKYIRTYKELRVGKCYLSTGIWSNWDVVQERDIMCNALQVTSLAGVAQILLSKYFHGFWFVRVVLINTWSQ